MKLILNTKRGPVVYDATPRAWSSKRGIGIASIVKGGVYTYYIADPTKPFEAGIAIRKPGKDATIANRYSN